MHRTEVTVAENALDAGNMIGRMFTSRRSRSKPLQAGHHAEPMRVGARTGEGVETIRAWLQALPARAGAAT